MQVAVRLRSTIDDRVVFLREFLKHPWQVASVTPSSRVLERRIVALADAASAHVVVEIGAGTGGTTRAILDAMPPRARLLVVEINPRFCALLDRIADARLIVHRGSATDLTDALAHHGLAAPDAVVSGIPFSTIDRRCGTRILESIASVLAPGGRFVAYQWSRRVDVLARPVLGPAQRETELRNIPPQRLYRWQKRAG
jgi:phosphatidylethanolamine/phosphatidyl-N-methylethanolamine N-methyltransferase